MIRTAVLLIGFALGMMESSLWIFFYTCRSSVRQSLDYSTEKEWDLVILTSVVSVDLVVNVLLVCGANKDYSGRKKDLRRWGFMVPWIFVYSVNVLCLLCISIVLCYAMSGLWKLVGVALILYTLLVLLAFLVVVFFALEQRADLDLHLHQRASQGPHSSAPVDSIS